jgi:hypothetical protein
VVANIGWYAVGSKTGPDELGELGCRWVRENLRGRPGFPDLSLVHEYDLIGGDASREDPDA